MCPVGSVWNNVLELALSSRGVITIAIANKNCTIHVILAESSKKNLSLSKSRQAKYSNQRVVVKFVFFFKASMAGNMKIFVVNIFSMLLLGWDISLLQFANAQVCQNWCASNDQEWQTKCNWANSCGGCAECTSGIMAAPYVHSK